MKDNTPNIFWTIIWAIVLICCIVALFWKWAVWGAILIAAVMVGVFINDWITVARLK